MRVPLIVFLILVASSAAGQVYVYCGDSVKMHYDNLNDLVRDTGLVSNVLNPNQVRQVRKRDLPGFSCTEPKKPEHQVLQLMDGFAGNVRISVDDSLVFAGKAVTDPSTGLANVQVDLGARHPGATKRLRVEYDNNCMMAQLDNGYPIVMVYHLTPWVVRLTDYWPTFE